MNVSEFPRRFAGIAARASDADLSGQLPAPNWPDVVDSGYLRVFHPVAVGGTAVDGVSQVAAMESLALACPSTYWSATMSTLLCGKLIHRYGELATHRPLLEALLSGRKLGAFAVVERTAGSDAGTYRTTVSKGRDGGLVISGEKARITNAPTGDLAVVLARLDERVDRDGHGWCFAFVDLGQPGVERYPMDHMGLRAMPWGGLRFDRAHVAPHDVVPVPYAEFAEGMAWGWLFISVSSIAIAEAALRACVTHARSHVSFGRPLGHMEGVQAQLARLRTEIDAARLLAQRVAWHRAAGRSARDEIAMLKAYATELAVAATQSALQIHGARALQPGHPVERLYRDAPMNVIGGFASNRLRELIAEGMGTGHAVYRPFDWLSGTGLDEDLSTAAGAGR
ncbi:hypothetical protein AAW14_27575 [Streptomyces hygroscopicus]|uniref:acyl-CoA dehydrogenase family protein n=1 Tax=Streptomyces hygroscopicus TaxID=1912 RepID=UPI00223FE553|nr:acyl-CoA dehydrogenase family protein [Streptomyces hygroscopicus]MCW7945660.1 hypothetical protein [Streptomyces hygroscopicus]